MRRACILLFGLVFLGVFTNPAFAADRTGYIEVCKAPNAALTDSFRFTIADAQDPPDVRTVTIGLGTCTQPIAVVPGNVTVSELGSLTGLDNAGNISGTPSREFISATTTAVGPTGPLGSGTGFDRTVTVPVSTNGSSGVVTVTYSNTLVTGVIEVCKSIVTGSGLTGSWSFTITGGNGFSSTQTVGIGNCSAPVTVPAGKVKVRETGDASEAVTSITATRTAAATSVVLGPLAGPAPDLDTATVVAGVVAGDASTQTLITFTNTSVRLKVCKYVDQGLTNLGPYSFSFPTVTGNAGPAGPIAPISITAGVGAANAVCQVVGTFRAGTTVTIVEGIVAGTKVGSIAVNPGTDAYDGGPTIVPGSLSLPNRTVTVELGKGETVVTYQNIPALPGQLKLCKVAGISPPGSPPVLPGTVFTFAVTLPSGAISNVLVPAGSCVVVGNFPFNTTLGITEAAITNVTVQSITALPSFVVVGGVNTNQPVLTNINLAGRSTNVTIGENNITEVTYVNIDPVDPPVVTGGGSTGGGTTGGSSGGGATSGGGSSSGGSSSSSSSAPAPAAVIPTTSSAPAPLSVGLGFGTTSSTVSTSSATKTATLNAAKLSSLEKQLTTLKAKLKKVLALRAHTTKPAVKHSLTKQIAKLNASKAQLTREIKLLK